MLRRLMFGVAAAMLPVSALAMQREADMAPERAPFESVRFTEEGASIVDTTGEDDLVLFDRATGLEAPPVIVDLAAVDIVPEQGAWKATFRFTEPLPEEPQFPINFDLFFDDGNSRNNATTGVFRAGSDMAFLLLFGTRTKWHTLTWQYDKETDRWAELTVPIEFSIGDQEVTMTIPNSLLPQKPSRNATIRAFALTSTGGITVVDVAPGMALPQVRLDAPVDAGVWISPTYLIFGILLLMLAASAYLWLRSR